MADLNLWSAKGHWHLFNGNSVIVNIHNRDTSDFANPTSEVAITCGDDVATGLTPLKKTIICVGPLVLTRQTLYPRVTQDPELKKRVLSIYDRLQLPPLPAYDTKELMSYIRHDKKAKHQSVSIVKVPRVGTFTIEELSYEQIEFILEKGALA